MTHNQHVGYKAPGMQRGKLGKLREANRTLISSVQSSQMGQSEEETPARKAGTFVSILCINECEFFSKIPSSSFLEFAAQLKNWNTMFISNIIFWFFPHDWKSWPIFMIDFSLVIIFFCISWIFTLLTTMARFHQGPHANLRFIESSIWTVELDYYEARWITSPFSCCVFQCYSAKWLVLFMAR